MLQAATVSKKIIGRKRKLKEVQSVTKLSADHSVHNITESSTIGNRNGPHESERNVTKNLKHFDGEGKKSRQVREDGNCKTPQLSRHHLSVNIRAGVSWPQNFIQLGRTHRALSIVYTFCCTRKHLATTFDAIRSAVEAQSGKPLMIEDVARIRTLLPQAVIFEYVDEARLRINLMGDAAKRNQNELPVWEADTGKEVLLFEFIDGDLRRQVPNAKSGEPSNAFRKLRHEDLKMPVYSQKQMLNLIEKRTSKFTSAVNSFINECIKKGVDPVEKLDKEHIMYIPQCRNSWSPTAAAAFQSKVPVCIPKERKSIAEILNEIKSLKWYTDQIVPHGHRIFDPQPPVYGNLDFKLSQEIINALYNARGISRLYTHQAEAINNLYDGRSVIVSTSTSSGKSLIYQVPVLHELEKDINTRAMYIFPTKALAQDQKRSLKDLMRYLPGLENTVIETFDGDTSMTDRSILRNEANVLFTNPDMLHVTILPNESRWRAFLQNLKFVVVDELHVYNGLFGAHVALIMRRLRRICAALGNRRVKFISCSATVANPEQHMKTIFGIENVRLTDFDGSPSGRKEFLCWNTPYKDPKDPTSGRSDTLAESAKLFCQLILRGVRVITFCVTRKQCEQLIGAVKSELIALERLEIMTKIMGYRGGYQPQDRRKIERDMFEGRIIGIVATNALELGVDIGSLDAVLTVGFPFSISNLRQQSGRAGRRNKDSLSVLIGNSFPTDQYYMANPDEIFTKPNCELQVNLENALVLEGHVQCAAHEMPLKPSIDTKYFGDQVEIIVRERLRQDKGGFYHCNERYLPWPSKYVAIRDTEEDHFAIIDTTKGQNVVLEELEASRAFFTIYEGGIFLHQGHTYLIKDFSTERMLAHVEKVKVDWITQQREYTDVDPLETEAIQQIDKSLSRAYFGPIRITQIVFGFFKLDKRRRILDAVEVDNPPIVRISRGFWLDVPAAALDILNARRLNIAAAIHAAEHALLGLLPGFVISLPGDVRTECKNALKEFARKETQRKRPARLTFYDAKGGATGSGISTKAFEFINVLLVRAAERVSACLCPEGCLECCCDERCHGANQVMSKAGANVILRSLLEWEIDVESLPWGDEESIPAGIETVVLAKEVYPAKDKKIKYANKI